MLTDDQALALAVHEAGHATIARLHGAWAVGMLHFNGEAVCYIDRELTGWPSRLVSASGPVAQHLLAHPRLTARQLWHAYRLGLLPFSDDDTAHAAPVTRRLLSAALVLVAEHWPAILAAGETEARAYRTRHWVTRELQAERQCGEVTAA